MLQDGSYEWRNRTEGAGAYPPLCCAEWVRCLADAAPAGAWGHDESLQQSLHEQLLECAASPQCDKASLGLTFPVRAEEYIARHPEVFLAPHGTSR